MLFRSRRSSTGAVSPRQSPAFAATVNNYAPIATAPAFERPSSAPVAGVVAQQQPSGSHSGPIPSPAKPDDVQSVEDRLNIVKRSRTSSSAKAVTTRESAASTLRSPELVPTPADPAPPEGVVLTAAAAPLNTGVKPPCSSYPTFSVSKLPKHEQHVMDALMREFTEVLFFSKGESQ